MILWQGCIVAIVYNDYCMITGKDSFGTNEESLINKIFGKNKTFKKYILEKKKNIVQEL